jgi:hypothetical protein
LFKPIRNTFFFKAFRKGKNNKPKLRKREIERKKENKGKRTKSARLYS